MFICDNKTVNECLERNLFGLPRHMMNKMNAISDSCYLFLYNKDRKEVYGIFRPNGRPAENIEPTAYAPLSFPAQVGWANPRILFGLGRFFNSGHASPCF